MNMRERSPRDSMRSPDTASARPYMGELSSSAPPAPVRMLSTSVSGCRSELPPPTSKTPDVLRPMTGISSPVEGILRLSIAASAADRTFGANAATAAPAPIALQNSRRDWRCMRMRHSLAGSAAPASPQSERRATDEQRQDIDQTPATATSTAGGGRWHYRRVIVADRDSELRAAIGHRAAREVAQLDGELLVALLRRIVDEGNCDDLVEIITRTPGQGTAAGDVVRAGSGAGIAREVIDADGSLRSAATAHQWIPRRALDRRDPAANETDAARVGVEDPRVVTEHEQDRKS